MTLVKYTAIGQITVNELFMVRDAFSVIFLHFLHVLRL